MGSRLAALALAVLVGIGACSSLAGAPTPPAGSTPASSDLLARYGLAGLTGQQVVEKLEAETADRADGPMGSVRYDEVILSDGDEKASVALPEDRFYLSIAPYVEQTHECYYHSLATCQGELVNAPLQVTITDAAGKSLVDETVTTHANGFYGFWLPRDITGTLTVRADGRSATVPIGTGPDDPTCLTTVKLS